jgi:hypothetical protein
VKAQAAAQKSFSSISRKTSRKYIDKQRERRLNSKNFKNEGSTQKTLKKNKAR